MKLYPADRSRVMGTLFVLAHGAGAGESHPFMVRYARGLAERGLDVVTFNFPYMDVRRRTPDRAPVLEDAFRRAVIEAVAVAGDGARQLLIGGKSMGGRMATHLAAAPDAWPKQALALSGVVVLGYPLRPPGTSRAQDRVSHLFKVTVPTLIVQGTRDSFGGPTDVAASLGNRAPHITIHAVHGGDHSFAVPKSSGRTQADVDRDVLDELTRWVLRLGA